MEVCDDDPLAHAGDVQSGTPRRIRRVERVSAGEAQRVRAVEDRYRRAARRLQAKVGDRERIAIRIDEYVDLALGVRAGYHAGIRHVKPRFEDLVVPSFARKAGNVNAVHLHAVGVGNLNRRDGSALHLRRKAASADGVLVGSVRQPEEHLAAVVGVDVVRAVARHLNLDLGVRREAFERHLVHLATAAVDWNGVAAVVIVEMLVRIGRGRIHAATCNFDSVRAGAVIAGSDVRGVSTAGSRTAVSHQRAAGNHNPASGTDVGGVPSANARAAVMGQTGGSPAATRHDPAA